MKYTEKVHAKRLLGMLNKKDPCMCCPKSRNYYPNNGSVWDYTKEDVLACQICHAFIGCRKTYDCPCDKLGKGKAIKRTWLALEEKGYI